MLRGYLANRSADERFLTFARRHHVESLKALFAAEVGE
jgi:hypothetical protein